MLYLSAPKTKFGLDVWFFLAFPRNAIIFILLRSSAFRYKRKIYMNVLTFCILSVRPSVCYSRYRRHCLCRRRRHHHHHMVHVWRGPMSKSIYRSVGWSVSTFVCPSFLLGFVWLMISGWFLP